VRRFRERGTRDFRSAYCQFIPGKLRKPGEAERPLRQGRTVASGSAILPSARSRPGLFDQEFSPMAFRLSSAVLLAALVAVPAYAAPTTTTKVDIAAFDPDKDGTVDLKEAQAAGSAAFDKLDPDKDGTLDAKELKGRVTEADLKKLDPDNDGTLDKKEYLAAVEAQFKAADPDNDGTIDAKELASPAGSALVNLIR
jgi:EF hand